MLHTVKTISDDSYYYCIIPYDLHHGQSEPLSESAGSEEVVVVVARALAWVLHMQDAQRPPRASWETNLFFWKLQFQQFAPLFRNTLLHAKELRCELSHRHRVATILECREVV